MVKDGAAKIHIYGALGKAQSATLRDRALEFNLSGSVRSQEGNANGDWILSFEVEVAWHFSCLRKGVI